MPLRKLIEKPDGARDVHAWDVRLERNYRPLWFSRQELAGHDPERVRLVISVEFDTNSGALDFERKVLDMMPEVEQ